MALFPVPKTTAARRAVELFLSCHVACRYAAFCGYPTLRIRIDYKNGHWQRLEGPRSPEEPK